MAPPESKKADAHVDRFGSQENIPVGVGSVLNAKPSRQRQTPVQRRKHFPGGIIHDPRQLDLIDYIRSRAGEP